MEISFEKPFKPVSTCFLSFFAELVTNVFFFNIVIHKVFMYFAVSGTPTLQNLIIRRDNSFSSTSDSVGLRPRDFGFYASCNVIS